MFNKKTEAFTIIASLSYEVDELIENDDEKANILKLIGKDNLDSF